MGKCFYCEPRSPDASPVQHLGSARRSHSGNFRGEVGARRAASTWLARASFISSTESSLRGEPRSVVMSLHGDEGDRGSDAFFFFGVIFFLSA